MARTRQRTTATTGDETKARIVAATIETLRTEGIVGTTARAVARTGDFNQALIYYHFGGLDDLLVAAVATMGAERLDRYRERLADVDTLSGLASVARELHHEDTASGNMTVLTQVLAGAAHDPELGPRVMEHFQPWTDLVAEVVERVLADSPLRGAIAADDLALLVSSLFLGVELFTTLDPDPDRESALFATLEGLARLAEAVLAAASPPSS